MFNSIKSKFIVSAIVIIILAVGGPMSFFVYQFNKNFEERSVMMLETTINVVLSCISHNMEHDEKNIQIVLERHVVSEHIKNMRIFDLSGKILYATDTSEIGEDISFIAPHHTAERDIKSITLIEPDTIYSAITPFKNEEKCQRCHEQKDTIAYLDIDSRLTKPEVQFYTGIRHSIFLGIVVILILIITLYLIFNSFISKPLKGVIDALSEVEKGNLHIRRPQKKEDEFGLLDRHFNNMVNQLEKSQQEINSFHFEQLQRADKLVTLGELAAEMAHEINNPAGVIMARADYIQLESENMVGLQKYGDDIEVILQQTQKIARITNNILKYSKKLPKDFHKIDVMKIINESIKIFEPRLIRRNILLKKIFLCDDKCKSALIYGDAQQIEQVTTNLINNAIDAIDNSGNLEISVGCTNNEKVQIIIKDDGMGIDEVSKEKIFLPFFTSKSAQKGTGLGLYIVKNILKNHGGDIECESAFGEGTTFTILFNKAK